MCTVKELLNGARLPNWVYLIALVVVLTWQAATVWFGQRSAIGDLGNLHHTDTQALVHAIDRVAYRDSVNYTQLNEKLDRRTDQMNTQLRKLSEGTGKILEKIE